MGYKKFCLVYEPKYKNKQVIIDFTNYDKKQKIVGIEIEKYSGISTAKKGKFYLSEIDKFTNSFDGINDIVRLINPFDQIHTFFIGLPYNGYVNIINPVFKNQSILNLAMKTYRDIVEDETEVNRLVKELINTDSDFYKFYLNSEYYKTLSIKNPDLRELIKKEIATNIKNKIGLKPFEKVKEFEILKDGFSMDNGLLSQTAKVKRNVIFEKYQDIISKMFNKNK